MQIVRLAVIIRCRAGVLIKRKRAIILADETKLAAILMAPIRRSKPDFASEIALTAMAFS